MPIIAKNQAKNEKLTDDESFYTSRIGLFCHKWSKLGQQNENNAIENISTVVDAIFLSFILTHCGGNVSKRYVNITPYTCRAEETFN